MQMFIKTDKIYIVWKMWFPEPEIKSKFLLKVNFVQ